MKIAFVVPTLQNGGAERMVATLSNFFSKKWEVVIITLLQKEIFYDISPAVKVRHVREAPPSENKLQAVVNNFSTIRNLFKTAKEENISLIISFTTTANVLSIITSLFLKIPCIISERNNSKVNPPNSFWRILRNFSYKYSSYLVVQTKGNKNIFSELLPKRKIKIIENAISETLETNIKTIKSKQSQSSTVKILTVGRLNPNKAQHVGLEALSKLTKYKWNYIIVGDGPSKQVLLNQCKALGIENRVTFTGSIKNVEDYYSSSDIFIFTSRSEGFPNALMEAYYFGIPCISTNCEHGPADIIRNEVDGFLIPIDDSEMLKIKLESLIIDKNLRIELSNAAKSNAQRFNIKNISNEWESLVDSCLSDKIS